MKKLVTFLLLVSNLAFAKETTFSGKVVDEKNNPIPYVNVFLLGTLDGSITDTKGNFNFKTTKNESFTLKATFIGYEDFEKNYKTEVPNSILITLFRSENTVKEVEISASAFTTSDDKKGVTLSTFEVITTPGASADVFKAIQTLPGIQKIGETAGLFVRGGDVSETSVYLDGALILHPYKYESPQGGFFGTFSPFLLKGTYFSSGGFPANNGNSLSGVLEMESLDIPEKREIIFGAGLAVISGKIALPYQNFGFSFSGNLIETKHLFRLNNSKKDWETYPKSNDLNLNFYYKISPKTSLKIFTFRENDKIGLSVTNKSDTTIFKSKTQNNLYNFRLVTAITKKIILKSNLASTNYESKSQTNFKTLNLKNSDKVHQFRLDTEWNFYKKMFFENGILLFKNSTDIVGIVPENVRDFGENAKTDTLNIAYRSNLNAFYSQLKLTLLRKLSFNFGFRAEHESISDEIAITPRISSVCKLTENSFLTSSFGFYNQFPESRFYDKHAGNPNLKAEKSRHYIFGYELKKDFQFRVESYYKTYQNLVLEDTTKNYTNGGNGFARGIDFFLKKDVKNWNGWASYSFLQAKRKEGEILKKSNPDFTIPHTFSLVLKRNFGQKFSTGIAVNYSTGKPYTSQKGVYNDNRVPFYLRTDVNFSYLHSFYKGNFTVFYLSVSNLLGRNNILDRIYSEDFSSYEVVKSSFLRSIYFGFSTSL